MVCQLQQYLLLMQCQSRGGMRTQVLLLLLGIATGQRMQQVVLVRAVQGSTMQLITAAAA
jgi:hypothetical protein